MIHRVEFDVASDDPSFFPVGNAWVLVRWGNRVLGETLLQIKRPSSHEMVRSDLLRAFLAEAYARSSPPPRQSDSYSASDITVIVEPGEHPPEMLEACLDSLAALSPSPREIIVNDSMREGAGVMPGPRDRARIIDARNTAWMNCQGRAVVFLDPRCRPQISYIARLSEAFEHEAIGAVSSLVTSLAFVTETQFTFDQRWLPHRRYRPTVWSSGIAKSFDPVSMHPGVGGGIAYDRRALEDVGGFPGQSGMTLRQAEYACLARLFDRGWVIRHQPDAVLCHLHPATKSEGLAWLRGLAYDRTVYRRSHPSTATPGQLVRTGRVLATATRRLARGDLELRRRLAVLLGSTRAMSPTVGGRRR